MLLNRLSFASLLVILSLTSAYAGGGNGQNNEDRKPSVVKKVQEKKYESVSSQMNLDDESARSVFKIAKDIETAVNGSEKLHGKVYLTCEQNTLAPHASLATYQPKVVGEKLSEATVQSMGELLVNHRGVLAKRDLLCDNGVKILPAGLVFIACYSQEDNRPNEYYRIKDGKLVDSQGKRFSEEKSTLRRGFIALECDLQNKTGSKFHGGTFIREIAPTMNAGCADLNLKRQAFEEPLLHVTLMKLSGTEDLQGENKHKKPRTFRETCDENLLKPVKNVGGAFSRIEQVVLNAENSRRQHCPMVLNANALVANAVNEQNQHVDKALRTFDPTFLLEGRKKQEWKNGKLDLTYPHEFVARITACEERCLEACKKFVKTSREELNANKATGTQAKQAQQQARVNFDRVYKELIELQEQYCKDYGDICRTPHLAEVIRTGVYKQFKSQLPKDVEPETMGKLYQRYFNDASPAEPQPVPTAEVKRVPAAVPATKPKTPAAVQVTSDELVSEIELYSNLYLEAKKNYERVEAYKYSKSATKDQYDEAVEAGFEYSELAKKLRKLQSKYYERYGDLYRPQNHEELVRSGLYERSQLSNLTAAKPVKPAPATAVKIGPAVAPKAPAAVPATTTQPKARQLPPPPAAKAPAKTVAAPKLKEEPKKQSAVAPATAKATFIKVAHLSKDESTKNDVTYTSSDTVKVETDFSSSTYQVSLPIAATLNQPLEIEVEGNLTQGAFSIGFLNGNKTKWLTKTSAVTKAGPFKVKLNLPADHNENQVLLMFCNGLTRPGKSKFEITKIK